LCDKLINESGKVTKAGKSEYVSDTHEPGMCAADGGENGVGSCPEYTRLFVEMNFIKQF
jgi:hypothetical protein